MKCSKAWVRERRGTRLTGDEALIFDGGFMLGERAKTLGLIDGFGDVDQLVKELGGEKGQARLAAPPPAARADAADHAQRRRSRPGCGGRPRLHPNIEIKCPSPKRSRRAK